jgi:hypothetical protein
MRWVLAHQPEMLSMRAVRSIDDTYTRTTGPKDSNRATGSDVDLNISCSSATVVGSDRFIAESDSLSNGPHTGLDIVTPFKRSLPGCVARVRTVKRRTPVHIHWRALAV